MPGILTGPGVQSIGSNQELADFASQVSSQTGIDARVIYAWGQQETGGSAIGHNWLNLRPYPGDPYSGVSSGGFEEYNSTQDAVSATVRRIRQPFAAPIVNAAKTNATPAAEIAAIASTGWDAGHYGGTGGPNLLRTFDSLYGAPAAGSPGTVTSVTGTTGGGNAGSGVGINSIPGVGSLEDAFKFVTSWRFAEVLGGFALLIVGLVLLGKQFGISPPAAIPVPV